MKKSYRFTLLMIVLFCLTFSSCSLLNGTSEYTIDYHSFYPPVPIPPADAEAKKTFRPGRTGDFITITRADGTRVSGYVTHNKDFLENVIKPEIEPYIETLKEMHPVEQINALTIFGHGIYRKYFYPDTFSWGGDLLDLDDPQDHGPAYKNRYGFDCSGFATMPYELAVYLGLMNPEEESAIFSSKGFQKYANQHDIQDTGGRVKTSNRFRVDTNDMKKLGRDIMTIPANSEPHNIDVKKLQPGDIVLLPEGHAGIVVEINNGLYYLESGGYVCPPHDNLPYELAPALSLFSEKGDLVIKRSLPDRKN